jgi:hypothetical protein
MAEELKEEFEGEHHSDVFDVVLHNWRYTDDLFINTMMDDFKYVQISLLVILVMFLFHLKSVFLTIVALLLIVFSIPLTALITEGIL